MRETVWAGSAFGSYFLIVKRYTWGSVFYTVHLTMATNKTEYFLVAQGKKVKDKMKIFADNFV